MSSADAGSQSPSPEPEPTSTAVSTQQSVLDELTGELGDAVVGSEVRHDDLWVRVRTDAWRRTAEVARGLGFDYFCFLSGIDWMPSTAPNPRGEGSQMADVGDVDGDGGAAEEESAEAGVEQPAEEQPAAGGPLETGYAGGDTRFQVLARLYSTRRHVGVTFKADLEEEAPRVDTWSPVYAGADWHERETWEMFGFDFVGHPHLAHLYLPGEFEGFPLRKDFPLLSREVKPWPGLVDVELLPPDPDVEEPATEEPQAAEAPASPDAGSGQPASGAAEPAGEGGGG